MSDGLHSFMFLEDRVYVAVEIAIIAQMSVATIARADAIYGDQIAVVNAWDFSKSGAKYLATRWKPNDKISPSSHTPIPTTTETTKTNSLTRTTTIKEHKINT